MKADGEVAAMADQVFSAMKKLIQHNTAPLVARITELEARISALEATHVKATVSEIRRVG